MNRLQQFFSDNWAIRRQDLASVMTLLMPSVVNGKIEAASALLDKVTCSARATGYPYMAKWYELDDLSIPDDSIAVIRLSGVIRAWDSRMLIELIDEAAHNPRIVGIVFEIDGPGGMISHLEQAVAAIEKCEKPTATVVTGVMASAHFWLGTAADRTFIASDICEVGSVGVVVTHYSFREFFKMNGIDYHEIYPDTADLKNRDVRDLEEKGDESMIKSHAERLHRIFADSVAKHLGIEYDPKLPLFRGAMFNGSEAVNSGYIDEFGDVAKAMEWVLAKATSRKAKQS